MSYSLSKYEDFDLMHPDRPVFSGKAKPPPPFTHRVPCYCGSELQLRPSEGCSVQCDCGGLVSFRNQRIVMEIA